MACVVNGVSAHSRKFSFRLQGTMGHRVSCKPLSHLLTISKYFQGSVDSPLRWCHWCLRLHPYFRVCLPQPQFDEDTIPLLLAFTDDDPAFPWPLQDPLNVLFVATYFQFDEDYVWPFFKRMLEESLAPGDVSSRTPLALLLSMLEHCSNTLARHFVRWLGHNIFLMDPLPYSKVYAARDNLEPLFREYQQRNVLPSDDHSDAWD